MADDKSKKTITAKDVASFLTDNPAEMSKLLATQPELLAACITAAVPRSGPMTKLTIRW